MVLRRQVLIGVAIAGGISMLIIVPWFYRRSRRPLTEGVWFEMVRALADRAQVDVRRVVLYDTPVANAAATPLRSVVLTAGLIEKLEPDEVRAVVAHEVAHLKRRDPQALLLRSSIVVWIVWGIFWAAGKALEPHLGPDYRILVQHPIFFIIPANLLVLLVTGRDRRKRELAADRLAAEWIGDPELVARALTRLHTLAAVPGRLKRGDEAISTHPSLAYRLEALRQTHVG
jgi:heat shock protein HtpX